MFLVSKFLVFGMEYCIAGGCVFCPPSCHKVFIGLNGLKDGGGANTSCLCFKLRNQNGVVLNEVKQHLAVHILENL